MLTKPEWINKDRLRRHIQAGLLYLANILWAIGAAIWIADEDWPLWKKALLGVLIGAGVIGLCLLSAWYVYTWHA